MKKTILIIVLLIVASSFASCSTTPADLQIIDSPTAVPAAADSTIEPVQTDTPAPEVTQTAEPTPTPIAPVTVQVSVQDAYPSLSFSRPLYFVTAGDGSDHCYVVEQTGKILVFEDSPEVSKASVFLDLSGIIDYDKGEKGLLGLAFHPDYAENGIFFVDYTDKNGTVIARYTRSAEDAMKADPGSAQTILTFAQPYKNHNGGQLEFGPDGYLYIATGDGGSGGDPLNNAQNLSSPLGKILRIDVDVQTADMQYSIPPDNPFAGNASGYREEIFAYGLRNPWRFSFDSEGVLWVADVGQNKIEEIDLVENGGNYGWSIMEGTHGYKDAGNADTSSFVPPIWEYEHDASECITGGYVYTSGNIPDLVGRYIYGDFESGIIWALWFDADGAVHNEQLIDTNLLISSFGIDANGDLRIMDLKGKVYRIVQS
jgi:glucose/arabinose dehydrogenase